MTRTLKDYRPQHDEDCRGGMCLCGWRKEAHEYALKPALVLCIGYRPVAMCSCGLDALMKAKLEPTHLQCVCTVDDGLVQEWVSKARDVARSKGYHFKANK